MRTLWFVLLIEFHTYFLQPTSIPEYPHPKFSSSLKLPFEEIRNNILLFCKNRQEGHINCETTCSCQETCTRTKTCCIDYKVLSETKVNSDANLKEIVKRRCAFIIWNLIFHFELFTSGSHFCLTFKTRN